MITKDQQTDVLFALDKAQSILNDPDTDDDIKCCLGGLIEDVSDMEVQDET